MNKVYRFTIGIYLGDLLVDTLWVAKGNVGLAMVVEAMIGMMVRVEPELQEEYDALHLAYTMKEI